MNSRVSPPASAGTLLQRARVAQGKSLEEVAAVTRLTRQRLASLERDELSGRNEFVFALGYIRSYARALELDPAPFEAAFRAQQPAPVEQAPPPPPVKRRVSVKQHWRVWLVLSLAVLGGILQLAPKWQPLMPDWMPRLPHWLSLPGQNVSYMAISLPGPYNIDDYIPEPAPVPAAPAPGKAEAVLSELKIAVRGPCWVDITDSKRRRLVAQLLQSGDNLALLGEPPFDVLLGNPAMVELTYAGERVPLPTQVGGRLVRLSVGNSTTVTAAEP